MVAWEKELFVLIKRRNEIAKGILPFLEEDSLKKELIENELFFVEGQINSILIYLKNELIDKY